MKTRDIGRTEASCHALTGRARLVTVEGHAIELAQVTRRSNDDRLSWQLPDTVEGEVQFEYYRPIASGCGWRRDAPAPDCFKIREVGGAGAQ